jgi:predicted RNase H-like nuclease (RuvC/YqgF family)
MGIRGKTATGEGAVVSYDQWKTTDPGDMELGNAKQPGESDELEDAYAEIKRLKEALEHVRDHGSALERIIERQGAEIKYLQSLLDRAAEVLEAAYGRITQLKGGFSKGKVALGE